MKLSAALDTSTARAAICDSRDATVVFEASVSDGDHNRFLGSFMNHMDDRPQDGFCARKPYQRGARASLVGPLYR
jgi:hypothetical protein